MRDNLTITLLGTSEDLKGIKMTKGSNIFLWVDPSNIAGILELNEIVRKQNAKEEGTAQNIIIDLLKAGYPPMAPEKVLQTYLGILELYKEAGLVQFKKVKTINKLVNMEVSNG